MRQPMGGLVAIRTAEAMATAFVAPLWPQSAVNLGAGPGCTPVLRLEIFQGALVVPGLALWVYVATWPFSNIRHEKDD